MPSRSKKRTNPRKIPLAKAAINQEEVIAEVSTGNLYHAWLLVLPTLVDIDGMTKEKAVSLWEAVNDYASDPSFTGAHLQAQMSRAEKLMGYPVPHQNMSFRGITTRGELEALKRKLKDNAIHAALCIIWLGIEKTQEFSEGSLRHLFLNANLTLAEVQAGYTTYEQLADEMENRGYALRESTDEMELSPV